MPRNACLFAAAFLVAAAPAVAQDAAPTFTGPRVEAVVGLNQLRFDLREVGRAGDAKKSDLGYGVNLGYDVALSPRLIGGVEVGSDFSDLSVARGGSTSGGFLRERRNLTIAGRLGAELTPNTLLYGKIGYANLQMRQDVTTAGVQSGSIRDLDGILAGAGLEVKIAPKAYVKSEYRYSNYADGYSSNAVTTGIGLRF